MAHAAPMTTATLLAGLPEFFVAELGDRVLRRAYADAGLRIGFKATAGLYVPEAAIMRMMESAARQAGDSALGALLGTHLNLGVYDTWGAYILEAQTLGESLKRFSSVIRYIASDHDMSLNVTNGQARLNYCWAVRKPAGYRQVCLASAGSFLNTLREYLGPTFLPDEIRLDIAKPERAAPVEEHLPTRLVYDARQISLRFPQDLLAAKCPSTVIRQPITLSDVRRRVISGPPDSIEGAVKQLVRIQILNGGPSFDQAARALNMNVRTLHRVLDRSGEGFRDLSGRIRMEIAEELLRETSMSVRDISEAVGYSDPYNFSRAFFQWFGLRPARVRSNLAGCLRT